VQGLRIAAAAAPQQPSALLTWPGKAGRAGEGLQQLGLQLPLRKEPGRAEPSSQGLAGQCWGSGRGWERRRKEKGP
jgi:hypothetical protein